MREPIQCVRTVAAGPGKPLAGPTPPAFHLQQIPAGFVAPIFLLLQPDTGIIPLRAPHFHSGDNKASWIYPKTAEGVSLQPQSHWLHLLTR